MTNDPIGMQLRCTLPDLPAPDASTPATSPPSPGEGDVADAPTITPDPDNPDQAIIHFPVTGYLDTQAWAVDVGIPAAALPALRNAINTRLSAGQDAGEQFGRAQRDVQAIVERLGWADPWVVVRTLWDRFRRLPVEAEPESAEQVQERIAAEYHRRSTRYHSGQVSKHAQDNVLGELTGLAGALGMALGHPVPGGAADEAAARYFEQWLARQETVSAGAAADTTVADAVPVPDAFTEGVSLGPWVQDDAHGRLLAEDEQPGPEPGA